MESTSLKTAVFLDDTRTPKESVPGHMPWKVVRSYKEFVELLTKFHALFGSLPDFISFDHDLHDEHLIDYAKYEVQGIPAIHYEDFKHGTGMDAATWLCTFCQTNELPLPKCAVHSQRPLGARNIKEALNAFMSFNGQVPSVFEWQVPSFTLQELGENSTQR